jgi:hypothetical protein
MVQSDGGGAKEMRYVCVTCGALRDDGDHCAVAPFGRQDCRWYRREPVSGARRHQVRTLVLVAVLMATAVSTISAMRLNPMAVSTMVEDRRAVEHAAAAPGIDCEEIWATTYSNVIDRSRPAKVICSANWTRDDFYGGDERSARATARR